METFEQISDKLEKYINYYLAEYFTSRNLELLKDYLYANVYDKSKTPKLAMSLITNFLKAILFYVKLSSATEPDDSLLSSTLSVSEQASGWTSLKIDRNLKTTFVPKNAINGKKIKYLFDAEFTGPNLSEETSVNEIKIEFYLIEQTSNGFYGRTRYEVTFLHDIETNPSYQIKRLINWKERFEKDISSD